jgi:hypothetical protein
MDIGLIWVNPERIYFCAPDWTGQISLIWLKKLDFTRTAFCRRIACRMGGAKAIPIYFVYESAGFRKGLNPSYELVVNPIGEVGDSLWQQKKQSTYNLEPDSFA